MEINAKETKQVTVSIEPEDAVKALIEHFGFEKIEWIDEYKGMIGYYEEVSPYGGYCDEYYGKNATDFELDLCKTLHHLQELMSQKDECSLCITKRNIAFRLMPYKEVKDLKKRMKKL